MIQDNVVLLQVKSTIATCGSILVKIYHLGTNFNNNKCVNTKGMTARGGTTKWYRRKLHGWSNAARSRFKLVLKLMPG